MFRELILEKLFVRKTNKSKIAIFERAYKYPKICEKLYQNNIKFRTLGAVALSLSNTIDYEFVLFAGNIREFDVEAALYICSDLYIYRTKDYLFITKYKEKYELFKEIINHLNIKIHVEKSSKGIISCFFCQYGRTIWVLYHDGDISFVFAGKVWTF